MRTTKLIIVLGYNGSGKTTLLKEFIKNEIKKESRALVITPDDIEFSELRILERLTPQDLDFTGARRTIYQEHYTLDKLEAFNKGLIIFDDCRSYLTAAVDMDIHSLLIRRRQRMLDIIAVGHGFTEVPPKFFTFASDIILFQTKDNIFKRKDVIKDFDKMLEAQTHVNLVAESDTHYFEIIKQ